MRVILLNSPSFSPTKYIKEGICQGTAVQMVWPPITLATIGAMLRRLPNVEVQLVDGNALKLSEKQLLSRYRTFNPDALVVNTTTPTFSADLKGAALAREVNPKVKIIMLGPHVTALANEIITLFQADIVVKNEPELIVYRLFKTILRGDDIHEVRGIVYRNEKGVVDTSGEDFIDDLDILPFPDRTLLQNNLYIHPLSWKPYTIVRTSRGCPIGCTFCSEFYYGNKWRTRSSENIAEEIQECVDKYRIYDFLMCSNNFTFDREVVISLCQKILERGLKISWTCNSRVDTVDEQLLTWMKKAGCQLITFGIESADEGILRSTGKNITPLMSKKAIQMTREAGIKSLGHFMFGLPGETKNTAARTIDFALELNPDYAEFLNAVPYSGTEFSRCLLGKGWINSRDWDRYDERRCDVYDLPGFPGSDLSKMPPKAYKIFYYRPSRIIKEIIHCFEYGGLKRMISIGWAFIGNIHFNSSRSRPLSA